MLPHTAAAIAALLKTDSSVTAAERQRFLADRPEPAERLVRLGEAARRIGVTRRTVSKLLEKGALQGVKLPGRTRVCGVRESDLLALIEGRKPSPGKAA
jgi:excisionase family DNA binding protein